MSDSLLPNTDPSGSKEAPHQELDARQKVLITNYVLKWIGIGGTILAALSGAVGYAISSHINAEVTERALKEFASSTKSVQEIYASQVKSLATEYVENLGKSVANASVAQAKLQILIEQVQRDEKEIKNIDGLLSKIEEELDEKTNLNSIQEYIYKRLNRDWVKLENSVPAFDPSCIYRLQFQTNVNGYQNHWFYPDVISDSRLLFHTFSIHFHVDKNNLSQTDPADASGDAARFKGQPVHIYKICLTANLG